MIAQLLCKICSRVPGCGAHFKTQILFRLFTFDNFQYAFTRCTIRSSVLLYRCRTAIESPHLHHITRKQQKGAGVEDSDDPDPSLVIRSRNESPKGGYSISWPFECRNM